MLSSVLGAGRADCLPLSWFKAGTAGDRLCPWYTHCKVILPIRCRLRDGNSRKRWVSASSRPALLPSASGTDAGRQLDSSSAFQIDQLSLRHRSGVYSQLLCQSPLLSATGAAGGAPAQASANGGRTTQTAAAGRCTFACILPGLNPLLASRLSYPVA